jgi:hypothetical protein
MRKQNILISPGSIGGKYNLSKKQRGIYVKQFKHRLRRQYKHQLSLENDNTIILAMPRYYS